MQTVPYEEVLSAGVAGAHLPGITLLCLSFLSPHWLFLLCTIPLFPLFFLFN